MGTIWQSLMHGWNAFKNPDERLRFDEGSYSYRPDRPRFNTTHERTIISSIYTRLANDIASINICHVRLDSDKRYSEDVNSGLNNCLNVEANLDQSARHFLLDIAKNLILEGVIAIVPVDVDVNPLYTAGYDIKTMRVGRVVQWYPKHVRVSLYNEETGMRQEIKLPKSLVAIPENPFYDVMNEPNSTLMRLMQKLSLLDVVDNQSSSGKLDIMIQLPYVIKSEARRQEAERRRKDIEVQLSGSKYGIAYVDGTEKITQLNRPAENNLLAQVDRLTELLYSQLGLTEAIMNGTADEQAMLNYLNRTIEPFLDTIVEEMRRKFLTKTARTQGQTIMYFKDPFKLLPLKDLAEITDKLTRNKVATANEMRQVFGWKPSKDPSADQLENSNMPSPSESDTSPIQIQEGDSQNGS